MLLYNLHINTRINISNTWQVRRDKTDYQRLTGEEVGIWPPPHLPDPLTSPAGDAEPLVSVKQTEPENSCEQTGPQRVVDNPSVTVSHISTGQTDSEVLLHNVDAHNVNVTGCYLT
jgi:hypothetical protein